MFAGAAVQASLLQVSVQGSLGAATGMVGVSARRGIVADVTMTAPPPTLGAGLAVGFDVRAPAPGEPPVSATFGLGREMGATVSPTGGSLNLGWQLVPSFVSFDVSVLGVTPNTTNANTGLAAPDATATRRLEPAKPNVIRARP